MSQFIQDRIKIVSGTDTVSMSGEKISEARFFFENSGSMDGYLKGVSEYKITIQNLMVLLKHSALSPAKLSASILNEKIYSIDKFEPENFATLLNPGTFPWTQGNRADSDLDSLIKRSLENHSQADITFFISDLIYGIKNQEPAPYLPVLRNQVFDSFLTIIKSKKISTLVIKINSGFNGTFWDYKYKGRDYKGSRPFYILAFANPEILDSLLKEIQIEKLGGYENHLRLDYGGDVKNNSQNIPYSFFCNSTSKGKCETDKIEDKLVKSIESIRMDAGEEVSIPFCAKIGSIINIPISYLMDSNNYESVEPFTLETLPPGNFKPMGVDKNFYKNLNPDVCYFISGRSLKNIPTNIHLTLKDQIPNWVASTSIIDDSIKQSIEFKTFGFQYFIEGVFEAYKKANNAPKSIFSIELTID